METSEEPTYRYELSRRWDGGTGTLLWIMLNPSTADAVEDDPTIGRVVGFSKKFGFSDCHVANLFALRATEPADLWAASAPVRHLQENVAELGRRLDRAGVVVAAWGAAPKAKAMGETVRGMATAAGVGLWCLGTTKSGGPKHPLYLAGNTELRPWQGYA